MGAFGDPRSGTGKAVSDEKLFDILTKRFVSLLIAHTYLSLTFISLQIGLGEGVESRYEVLRRRHSIAAPLCHGRHLAYLPPGEYSLALANWGKEQQTERGNSALGACFLCLCNYFLLTGLLVLCRLSPSS